MEIKFEAAEFNHPGVVLEQKESLKRIFDAINSLKSNQKTAIILHKIEHLTQNQIAEIMEISPKAVESLIQRAKQNLYKTLDYSKD
jgi:RNA polymerase sigma-70 factor (ECF subfamily)